MKKILVIFLTLLLVGLILCLPRIIIIKHLVCSSQFGPCSHFISEKLIDAAGKNLFESRKSVKQILGKEFFAISYSVQYNLPDKLVVNLIERKAVIALSYTGEHWWAIDQEGLIIGESETTGLPALKIEGAQANLSVGAKLPERLFFAMNLLQRLNYSYQITYARVTENAIEVQMPNGLEIIFPSEGDSEVLTGSLALLLSQLKTEAGYSIIDLRYKNPVLR